MTREPAEFLPEALAEARAAYRWYFQRSPLAARAFLDELDHAVNMVAENPERWPGYILGSRRFLMRRFPFSVIYKVVSAKPIILAIAHARRRPGYWSSRKP